MSAPRTSSRFTVFLALVEVLLLSAAFASKNDVEAAALMARAKQLSDIRSEGAPAFRLRTSFKIIWKNGSALQGEYSEIWFSKTKWRTETVAGDFHRTQNAVDRKRWLLDSTAAIPEQLPAGSDFSGVNMLRAEAWKAHKIETRDRNGRRMRCLEAVKSSLCFDESQGTLVYAVTPPLAGSASRDNACSYSDYQKFGDHLVARSYVCTEHSVTTIEAKVVELATNPAPEQELFIPGAGAKESVNCLGPVLPPKLERQVDPTLPQFSLGGNTVVMSIVVGTSGTPRDFSVLTRPDQQFDHAALEAVKQWRFQPATCDGEPVETKIAVEIYFHPT